MQGLGHPRPEEAASCPAVPLIHLPEDTAEPRLGLATPTPVDVHHKGDEATPKVAAVFGPLPPHDDGLRSFAAHGLRHTMEASMQMRPWMPWW